MKLSRLLASLDGCRVLNFNDKEIASIQCDSRSIGRGDLFVAVCGSKTDGAAFAADAVAAGAAAVVASRRTPVPREIPLVIVPDDRLAASRLAACFCGYPSARMQVIGITGTNGKTTVSYLVRSIIRAAGEEAGLIGTIGYEFARNRIAAANTTPGPLELHRMLAQMLAGGIDRAVVEVSSHALSQQRVRDVRFDAAIYTNISHEHLDYHGDIENYLAAKAILFERLGTDAAAIINADDQGGKKIAARTSAQVTTYGIKGGTIRGQVQRAAMDGSTFTIETPSGKIEVNWPLIGIHNVYNALAAAACAEKLGYEPAAIREGLENCEQVPGRLERVDRGQPFCVLVDYAHTDDALDTVLSNLSRLEHRRLLVVFGCGGDRDRAKRPKMGAAVERWSDRFWVTSDNPRTEEPLAIIEEIGGGLSPSAPCEIEPDRREAIRKAIAAAGDGDVVLIAGKGHETGQIFGGRVVPFDDRLVAVEALEELYPARRAATRLAVGDQGR